MRSCDRPWGNRPFLAHLGQIYSKAQKSSRKWPLSEKGVSSTFPHTYTWLGSLTPVSQERGTRWVSASGHQCHCSQRPAARLVPAKCHPLLSSLVLRLLGPEACLGQLCTNDPQSYPNKWCWVQGRRAGMKAPRPGGGPDTSPVAEGAEAIRCPPPWVCSTPSLPRSPVPQHFEAPQPSAQRQGGRVHKALRARPWAQGWGLGEPPTGGAGDAVAPPPTAETPGICGEQPQPGSQGYTRAEGPGPRDVRAWDRICMERISNLTDFF